MADEILYHEAALNALTKIQLHTLCERYDLKTGGKPSDLVQRLQDYGRRLNAFEKANTTQDRGDIEVLRSQRPHLQQRRSSRSSQSRSPSPWNPFGSDRRSKREGPFELSQQSSAYVQGILPQRYQDRPAQNVLDKTQRMQVDADQDESAWEVLSDRRASFETRDRGCASVDLDEATRLGRSIPGSYARATDDRQEEQEGRYDTLKSWKSAENGGSDPRNTTEEEVMSDFGSMTSRKAAIDHKRTTSLTRKSFESLRAMTASFSLPTKFRNRRVPILPQDEQADNQAAKPAKRTSQTVLNRAKSMIEVKKTHARKRSSPFVQPSPGSTRYLPYSPPLYRNRAVPSPGTDLVVGVPQRHSHRINVNRGSTIRIVGSSAPERLSSAEASSIREVPEAAWLMGLPTDNMTDEMSRSPSPPAPSMLPPLRQSTLAEDLTGMSSFLDNETGVEPALESEEEQELLLDEEVHASKGNMSAAVRAAFSPTDPSFCVPGSYPQESTSSVLRHEAQGDHFQFGSFAHGVSNDHFAKAGEDLLQEINAKLQDRGIAGIRRSTLSRTPLGCEVPVGPSAHGTDNRAVSDRYDQAHRKEFSKMAELKAYYPGRRPAQNGLPQNHTQPLRSAKRKASAEFTPSAPNGMPLRHARSAVLPGREDKTRRLDRVEDAENSPRIKRMRVDRSAAADERNGGRARISSGFGAVTALTQGTRNTVMSVKKRLSVGPDASLTRVGTQPSNALGRVASADQSRRPSLLPQHSTMSRHDGRSSQNRSYAKSSRPPPPPPHALSELGTRSHPTARATTGLQSHISISPSNSRGTAQTTRLRAPSVVLHGSTFGTSAMLAQEGKIRSVSAKTRPANDVISNTSSRVQGAPSREQSTTLPVLSTRTSTWRHEQLPENPGKPVPRGSSVHSRRSPLKSRIGINKERLPFLEKTVTKTSVMLSPARTKSKLRSPSAIGSRARASSSNLRMAAKQHELMAKRSQMDAERQLREVLG